MKAYRLHFDPSEIGIAQLMRSQAVGDIVNDVTDKVHTEVVRNSGDADDEYRQAIYKQPARLSGKSWYGEVGVDSPFWHIFEFGATYLSPRRILTRAAHRFGMELEGDR